MNFNIKCIGKLPGPTNEFERSLVFETGEFERSKFDCSIFKDNLVITSIPNYFNNSETPIICYKYSKPIRSTIFKFNKIVTDIDSNTPDS